MGLELEDSAAFEFLGRLPDRDITARGQRMADSALAAFVFAQRPGASVPPLAVQASEIAATRWAHESCLRPAEVQYNVHRPYSLLPDRVASLLPPALLRSIGRTSTICPSPLRAPPFTWTSRAPCCPASFTVSLRSAALSMLAAALVALGPPIL